MKFLICPTSDAVIEALGEEGLFKAPSGTLYNYELDFSEDMVRITDSLERFVPVDVAELDDLIFMLNRISTYVKNSARVEDYLFNTLVQGASQ